MTIEKGKPWGEAGALAAHGVLARSDREVRAAVEPARRAGAPVPEIGLLGGDLCRTMGGQGNAARLRTTEAMRLPIDLGSVVIDGMQHWFTAHLVARRSWWRGRVVAVMNAQWIGTWDVAPKSHPNDGLLDVFDGDISVDDRMKARRRLLTGTHVPHPGIAQRRVAAVQIDLARPTPIWLDGERVALGRELIIAVEPDAFTAVV